MARPTPQPATAGKLCQSLELRVSSRQEKANSKQSAQSKDLGELVRRPWHGRRQEAAPENAFCQDLDPLGQGFSWRAGNFFFAHREVWWA